MKIDKKCTRCGNYFPFTIDYWYRDKSKKDGFLPHCKKCNKKYYTAHRQERLQYRKIYYQKNRIKLLENAKKYALTHQRERQDYKLRCAHGITRAAYNEMLVQQNYCCAICGKYQNAFPRRLSVDHNHETGLIRGLLCHRCNRFIMGYIGDDKNLQIGVVKYLEKSWI